MDAAVDDEDDERPLSSSNRLLSLKEMEAEESAYEAVLQERRDQLAYIGRKLEAMRLAEKMGVKFTTLAEFAKLDSWRGIKNSVSSAETTLDNTDSESGVATPEIVRSQSGLLTAL